MTYIAWAALYEGPTDKSYLEVLIPRMMEEIIMASGVRTSNIPETPAVVFSRGPVRQVASEACEASNAFHLVFIHADAGGRNLRAAINPRSCAYCDAMAEMCNFPKRRCIVISPRHETEAWVLADATAVVTALGYTGSAASIGLPADAHAAEALPDPKTVLESAMRAVRGRHRATNIHQMFAAIAQRQSLAHLRRADSFVEFETALSGALRDIGSV